MFTQCVDSLNINIYYADMTKFQIFLKQLGVEKASQVFHISKRTAHAYMRGDRSPRLNNVPNLVRLSKGKLSLNAFFPENTVK